MASTYLSRPEAAEFIQAYGLAISPKTLQKYATVGGGPAYRRFGRRVVYTRDDIEIWIDEKLSEPISSTSAEVEHPSADHRSASAPLSSRGKCHEL